MPGRHAASRMGRRGESPTIFSAPIIGWKGPRHAKSKGRHRGGGKGKHRLWGLF